jgi:lipopolysaccharide export LptBFGC system permease protein LptF
LPFIDEMGDVSDTYTLLDVLSFVMLTAPRRLYEMLPMAALIGCLIGLGSLASSSELTVMRAAGVSIGRIVWAVMKPMLVLMLAGVLIGEYVAPATESMAQANRSLAQGSGDAQSAKHGMWHRQGDEFIHINAVQPNGLLYGVTRYHFDKERHLLSSSFAKKAEFDGSLAAHRRRDHRCSMKRSTEVVNAPAERWDVSLSPQLLSTVVMAPGVAVDQRVVGLHPLSGRTGPEQRPLLAGILGQGVAAVGHCRAGADGDFLHLRPAAFGDPRSACVHRRAGGLHLPYRPGSARPFEPGVRFLAAVRGAGAGGCLCAGGCLAAAKSRLMTGDPAVL